MTHKIEVRNGAARRVRVWPVASVLLVLVSLALVGAALGVLSCLL